MNNWNTRFTALGMKGTGKTCYIMGMYSEMSSGIRGWSLKTANIDADRITRRLKRMQNEVGPDRFPPGTQDTTFDDYEFELYFCHNKVMNFNWIDYAGVILEDSSSGYDTLKCLDDSILNSTTLYIFVDGELFCNGDTKRKIKKVRNECGNYINPRITEFMSNHKNQIPPVVFVVTKSDLCDKYTDMNEIKEVLKKSFSSIFLSDETLAYIVKVSLGNEIAENDYSGEIDPVQVQTPFFIGIAHDFFSKCTELMAEIEADNKKMQNAISDCENEIERDNASIELSRLNIEMEELHMDLISRRSQAKKEQNKAYLRKIEQAKAEIQKNDDAIRNQQEYISSKSGKGLFGFFTRLLYKSVITEAEANIRQYQKQKAEADSYVSENEKNISNNNNTIEKNDSEISDIKKSINSNHREINNKEDNIHRNMEIIEQSEENIRINTEKCNKYKELLKDIWSELKCQSATGNFIAIKAGQEIDINLNLDF